MLALTNETGCSVVIIDIDSYKYAKINNTMKG
jgi:hypothetical protein